MKLHKTKISYPIFFLLFVGIPGLLWSQQNSLNLSLSAQKQQQERQTTTQKPVTTRISQSNAVNFAFDEPIDPEKYKVGPGDQFSISIQSVNSQYFELVVSPTGELLVPGIGTFDVLEKSLLEVREIVKERTKAVFKNSQVDFALMVPRIISVYLVGAVQNPGSYDVVYTSRISDVLDNTQSSLLFTKPNYLKVISDNDTSEINYHEYLYGGNLKENPRLRTGDIIYVEQTNPGVSVTGYVASPGVYPYIPGFTYIDYVSMAGGELPQGDAARYVLTGNAQSVKEHSSKIEAGDHIFVPRSRSYFWIGQTPILQIVTSVASLMLTFIAATR